MDALILDLLAWIGPGPRGYAEVMDAWRTSCPWLLVWEEANDRGFIARRGAWIAVTPEGREFVGKQRSPRPPDPRPAPR